MPLRPCTGSLAETVNHLMADDIFRIKILLLSFNFKIIQLYAIRRLFFYHEINQFFSTTFITTIRSIFFTYSNI